MSACENNVRLLKGKKMFWWEVYSETKSMREKKKKLPKKEREKQKRFLSTISKESGFPSGTVRLRKDSNYEYKT